MDHWDGDNKLRIDGDAWVGIETDEVNDLPEVVAARASGWEPAADALLWCFLPAVWPIGHRAWIPDRRVRYSSVADASGAQKRAPWGTWTYAEIEADYNRVIVSCGFPPRPFGRLWLLRVVAPWESVDQLLKRIVDEWDEDHDVIANREFANYAQIQLERTFFG